MELTIKMCHTAKQRRNTAECIIRWPRPRTGCADVSRSISICMCTRLMDAWGGVVSHLPVRGYIAYCTSALVECLKATRTTNSLSISGGIFFKTFHPTFQSFSSLFQDFFKTFSRLWTLWNSFFYALWNSFFYESSGMVLQRQIRGCCIPPDPSLRAIFRRLKLCHFPRDIVSYTSSSYNALIDAVHRGWDEPLFWSHHTKVKTASYYI